MKLIASGPCDGRVGDHDVVLASISMDPRTGVVVVIELDDETTATLVLPAESINQAADGLESGRTAA